MSRDGTGENYMVLTQNYSDDPVLETNYVAEITPTLVSKKEVVSVKFGGTGGTDAKAARTNLGFAKQLWNGSWAAGTTITIPDFDKYMVFLLDVTGTNCRILAVKEGGEIRGLSGMGTSTKATYLEGFAGTYSGNDVTYSAYTQRTINSSNEINLRGENENIVAVWGLA